MVQNTLFTLSTLCSGQITLYAYAMSEIVVILNTSTSITTTTVAHGQITTVPTFTANSRNESE